MNYELRILNLLGKDAFLFEYVNGNDLNGYK